MTLGELVNGILDAILATGDRILQLPLFLVLLAAGLGALLCAVPLAWLLRARFGRVLAWTAALALLLVAAWAVDRRIAALQQDVAELRMRLVAAPPDAGAGAVVEPQSRSAASLPASRANDARPFLFDQAATQAKLTAALGPVTLRPQRCGDALDFVTVHVDQPLAEACLAVVDLRHPDLEVRLGTDLERKTRTSDFARATQCLVAINGEAGNSPFANSGLGPWRGPLVDRGQVLLREEPGNPRPFLAFDRSNHATFNAMAWTDRTVPEGSWNVIWGRFDVLLDGEVQTFDARNRQPRTAMAIDRDGTRLYLLVVDGRQPRHSMGLTLEETGHLLRAFGAHRGMLCDEGGSSCMYLAAKGGIVNVPSDNQGSERTTYTHFGIGLRKPAR